MSQTTPSELLEEVTRLRRRVGELEQQQQIRIDGASTVVPRGPVGVPHPPVEQGRSLLNALPCAVVECDLTGMIRCANPFFARQHGFSQDELVDTFYAELIDGEEGRIVFYQLLGQLASGSMSSCTQHTVHGRRDGHSIPVQVKWGIQSDVSGHVIGLLGVVSEDSHSATENDKAIDLAGEYFKLVREMILVVNAEQEISLINPHGCRLLEAEESEILGKNWFDHFLPDSNREEVRTLFNQLMQGEIQPVEFFENDIQTAAGRVKRVAWHNSILRDDTERIIGTLSVGIDITGRLEDQQALRESRQIFHQISEHINELLWVSSADFSKLYYISPKYEEFWGLSCQSTYDDPALWLERIHPEDRESLLQSMNRKIQGDFSSTNFPQFRVVHTDGTIRWLESRSFPVYNERQQVTRLVGIIEDITQRKEDADAILKSNVELERRVRKRTAELARKTVQLNALFQGLPDIVLVINPQGDIINFNSRRRKDLFSSRDLSSDRKIWDLLPAEIGNQFAAVIQRVHADQIMESIEYPLQVQEQTHWYRARVQPYLSQEVLLIIENISEQKFAAIELKRTHEKLSEAQRLAHIGSWEWNVEDDSLWWSDEVFRIFGLSPGSFQPTYPSFLETIHPDDRELVERVVAQTLKYDLPYNIEHRIILPNGTIRYVHEQGALKRNAAGEIVRMHGTVQDISERHETARKTQEYRDILAHASRLAIMGELTAGISHELNQPLTAIANYSSAMKSRIEQGLEITDLVQRIEALSLRSGNIVHKLRSMAEKRTQEFMLFNILDSIRSALQFIEYELRQREIDVQLISDSRMTLVYADRIQIEQVLSNLFLNAKDAMQEAPLPRKLTVTVAPADHFMIRVTVADTGMGVPDDFVGQLFTPFTSNKEGGLGIGLSLSRSLIEASGGRIGYRPQAGVGAAFDVFIPTREMND